MKKLFFIAAIASAALVSCTKNELAPAAEENKISFYPVLSTVTKAITPGELTAADYREDFIVNAWYQADDVSASFDPEKATSVYMDEITAKFKAGNVDDVSVGTTGAWFPYTTDYVTYYWPKNGKLTFSAYSPAEAAGTAAFNVKTGLTITDFVVAAAIENQYDLLYSDRTYDKTSSTQSAATSALYDGVDIKFHHALSSIVVKAQTAADYGTGAITIDDVQLVNVYSKGTFAETLATGKEADSSSSATWGATQSEETTYDLYKPTTNISLTTAPAVLNIVGATETDCILLPQPFVHTATSKKVTLVVNYTVKNSDGTTLAQVATLPLDVDSTNDLWEMGYRYTYTLTFTLDTVYFSPTIDVWEEGEKPESSIS